MINQTIIQRLGIIRYLYETAMEESLRPEPFGLFSILKFHDSIELFLDSACDKFGIPGKRTSQFKDYWTELEMNLNQTLSEKRSMERLNNARIAFKHHGNLPHASSIQRFRVNVTDFFEDNTPLIFGLDFSKISMTYLILNDAIRTALEEASQLIEAEEKESAIAKIAIAFAQLLKEYGSRTLFPFDHSVSGIFTESTDLASEVQDFASDVESALFDMQNAIKILALGLDYRKYAKFQLLTPSVKKNSRSGKYEVSPKNIKVETLTLDHCRFCYDFVIESAIELQTIDLGVKVVPTYQFPELDESLLEEIAKQIAEERSSKRDNQQ